MAATGASGIAGGNFKIFEQFVKRSNATLHLNTRVRWLQHKLSICQSP